MHPTCLSEVSVVFSEFLQAFRSLISHFWAAAAAEDGGGRVSNQMTKRSRQPSAASGCKPSGSKAGQGARGPQGRARVPPPEGTPSRLSAGPLRALLPIADGAYRPPRGRGGAAGCAWCGGAVDTRRLGVGGCWMAGLDCQLKVGRKEMWRERHARIYPAVRTSVRLMQLPDQPQSQLLMPAAVS